ncbi:MAG: uroporphyrinogen-III synthase [Hyphomicrobiaceae bacterium]
MRVLITRPEPDAMKMKGIVEERGHEAVVEPLLSVSFDDCEPIDLEGVTALIATSRNGLRALREANLVQQARGLTVFTVGAATAEEARRMGFRTVIKGPGTATGLAPMIASVLDPSEDVLLHLAGDRVAVELARELEENGFRASKTVVYRMKPIERLGDVVLDELADGSIQAILLMSSDTAVTWARLITRQRLGDVIRDIPHLCLSDAIASRLKGLGPLPIEVADQPTLEEMLALIDLAAAQGDL